MAIVEWPWGSWLTKPCLPDCSRVLSSLSLHFHITIMSGVIFTLSLLLSQTPHMQSVYPQLVMSTLTTILVSVKMTLKTKFEMESPMKVIEKY